MTDLERIARAIWADRAARILAEDIAAQREEGSAGHMSYDDLGEGFQRGLLSEARAALQSIEIPLPEISVLGQIEQESGSGASVIWMKMVRAMLKGKNAPTP